MTLHDHDTLNNIYIKLMKWLEILFSLSKKKAAGGGRGRGGGDILVVMQAQETCTFEVEGIITVSVAVR